MPRWFSLTAICQSEAAPDACTSAMIGRRLGVWSRDEVVRVDLERSRVLCPGLADGLNGGSPSEPLEVLGKVVSRDEGQDVGLQALQGLVVEDLHGSLLDRAVHPLSLTVRPRVIRLGQPVLDAVLAADPVEDVPHPGRRW